VKPDGVGDRFLEHGLEKLGAELLRSCVVVVNDDLEVAGLVGLNIAH